MSGAHRRLALLDVDRGAALHYVCAHWKAHDVKCHPAAARISSQSASWAGPPLHSSQLPAYARQCESVSSRFFAHRLAFGRPRPEGMKPTNCANVNSVKSHLHTASACLEAAEAPEPLCPVLLPHSVPAPHTKATEQGRHRDRPMPPRAAPAEHTHDRILFIHSCSAAVTQVALKPSNLIHITAGEEWH